MPERTIFEFATPGITEQGRADMCADLEGLTQDGQAAVLVVAACFQQFVTTEPLQAMAFVGTFAKRLKQTLATWDQMRLDVPDVFEQLQGELHAEFPENVAKGVLQAAQRIQAAQAAPRLDLSAVRN